MIDSTDIRKSKKQGQIVETAESLFKRHGIRRVTVEEICREARVSKMTFYKYFKNKIELVKYLISNWFEDGFATTDKINAMDVPVSQKLRLMIEWKMGFISDMSPEFIEEFVHIDSEMKEFITRHYQLSFNRFLMYFSGWQKNGDIRPGIRPELILAALGKIQELFKDDALRNLYSDHIEFAHELHSFLFYGIIGTKNNSEI
ncbi:TetR/AcrR family transcriptional regulator [Candidatus Latescibacterota bacterium]